MTDTQPSETAAYYRRAHHEMTQEAARQRDRAAAAEVKVAEQAETLDRVRALADEWERTGERLHGVPAASTWLLVSADLNRALASQDRTDEGADQTRSVEQDGGA